MRHGSRNPAALSPSPEASFPSALSALRPRGIADRELWDHMSKGGQPNVEPFTPPPPQEGCNCGVCNPYIDPKYQAAYDAQQISPFIRYKSVTTFPQSFQYLPPLSHSADLFCGQHSPTNRIVKEDENGNTSELSEDELRSLERSHPELCEWNKPAARCLPVVHLKSAFFLFLRNACGSLILLQNSL